MIVKRIREQDLNRIVVAACTPRTHEPLFKETLKASGLSENLFEMANIRNQASWVHAGEPEAATLKAKDLVRMAVAKAALLESRPPMSVGVSKTALVVGGGLAGMTAALLLADQGFPVHLVESSPRLGGAGVIAIGGQPYKPNEYEYGRSRRVFTALEFDKLHLYKDPRIARGKNYV